MRSFLVFSRSAAFSLTLITSFALSSVALALPPRLSSAPPSATSRSFVAPTLAISARLIAQEASGKPETLEAPKPEPVKGGEYPVLPWVIEGLGIGLFAVGFVCLALAAGQASERDQLLNKSKTEIAETGTSKVKAADLKGAEDRAIALHLAGWVLGGVGVSAMLVGAIWILAYQPPKDPSARRALPPTTPPMAYGSQPTQVLFAAD